MNATNDDREAMPQPLLSSTKIVTPAGPPVAAEPQATSLSESRDAPDAKKAKPQKRGRARNAHITKGKRGERDVAEMINAAIPEANARRSFGQSRKSGETCDVVTDCLPFWIEVKRTEGESIESAMRQAVAERKDRPVWAAVFSKRNRGEWLVTMTAEDFADLLKEWWERR